MGEGELSSKPSAAHEHASSSAAGGGLCGRLMRTLKHDAANVDLHTVNLISVNMIASIGIVFLNKWLFVYLAFPFSTTVTFLHFVTTALGLQICVWLKMFTPKALPMSAVAALSFSFCGFVVLANFSLLLNSVGFYQIMKVLTTPVIVGIQTVLYKKTFSSSEKSSLGLICIGVAIATVTDFEVNLFGTIVALLAVLVTSFYQVWVGEYQKALEANSMQLLYYQAPASAIILLFVIPVFDDLSLLQSFEWTTEAQVVLGLSCLASFFVNLSIFLLIGKTSPITYNAVGHFKLVLILIGGVLLFNAPVTFENSTGVVVAVVGLIAYTHIKLSQPSK